MVIAEVACASVYLCLCFAPVAGGFCFRVAARVCLFLLCFCFAPNYWTAFGLCPEVMLFAVCGFVLQLFVE